MKKVNNSDKFEMFTDIREGDLIETGAKPVLADISAYEKLFKICESVVAMQANNPRFSYGMMTYRMCETEAKDLGMNVTDYAHIPVIDAKLNVDIKNHEINEKELERQGKLNLTVAELLGAPVKPVELSSLVNEGLAMCTECSIIAQAYLQRQGIESYLCKGELFQAQRNNQIIHEAHHFLAIKDRDSGTMMIYDPLNTRETGIPRVINTGLQKDEFIKLADRKDGFLIDASNYADKLNSALDIGDPHELAYGTVSSKDRILIKAAKGRDDY